MGEEAVLQKPEEEHKERSFAILLLYLDSHSELMFRLNRTSGSVLSGLPAHIARLLSPLGMHLSEVEMEKPLNQDNWRDGPRGKR